MTKHKAICILFAALFWAAAGHVQAGSLDFVVIQPGQPGTEAEARPVMDALAGYLKQKMGTGIKIQGRYFNRLDPAMAFLKSSSPAWGIVGLGVYARHWTGFQMYPMAATRPGGFEKDIWRLMVPKDVSSDWRALSGKVRGNMLFETHAAACLLFGMPPGQLPFTLEGTFRPLRSARSVVKGKITGVVLDRVQYETLPTLSVGRKVKVVHTSRELPTSPVIWFGTANEVTEKLARVLQGMKGDPNAENLLTLLQTDGFGSPDADLLQFRCGVKKDVCFIP